MSARIPKFPETERVLRQSFGPALELVDQCPSYGFWYELYHAEMSGQHWWYIATPLQQVYGVLLPLDVEQAKKDFHYIAEHVTLQQEGWADQGRLSCPAQAMRAFLEKRQVLHVEGWVSPSGIICWGNWKGLQKYPEFT